MKIYIDKELFQWEKGRIVLIENEDNSTMPSFVQFYNNKMDKSLNSTVVDGKARIPDQLLKYNLPIMAVACIGTEEDSQVLCRREFKVIKRASPISVPDADEPEDTDVEIIYDGGEEY